MIKDKLRALNKIAVVRANGLGDFIFALPALHALRTTYPSAEIVYLGKPWHQELLQHRSGPIDRVVIVPQYHGVRDEPDHVESTEEEHELFFHAMQAEHFDLALQIHGGGRYSNPFVRRLRAKITVGLKTKDAEPLDISIPYVYYQSEIVRYIEVMQAIGCTITSLEPRITALPKDITAIQQWLSFTDRQRIMLHPGASDIRRRWSTSHFAELGNALAAAGNTIILTGTNNETVIVEEVIKKMHYPAVNLCGKLSLSTLIGLCNQVDLVISNDTGPLHLVNALGTPTVGIFWCGNVITGGPLFRSRHRPVLSWVTHCPRCNTDIAGPGYPFTPEHIQADCQHQLSFVDKVTVAEVLDQVNALLQDSQKKHGAQIN